jgi:hypothetical protein
MNLNGKKKYEKKKKANEAVSSLPTFIMSFPRYGTGYIHGWYRCVLGVVSKRSATLDMQGGNFSSRVPELLWWGCTRSGAIRGNITCYLSVFQNSG